MRFEPAFLHADAPLSRRQYVLIEWKPDVARLAAPGTVNERKVKLAYPSFTKLGMQRSQRRALLGQQQDA